MSDNGLNVFYTFCFDSNIHHIYTSYHGNLSFEERSALKDLKSNVKLVIREADKGCSVVVMDRQRYIEEGYRQLNDTSVYLRTLATTISDIEEDIQRLADQLHIEGVITDDIRQFAIRRNTKPARFYLLPKVHKKRCTRQTSCFSVRFCH